MSSAPIGSLKRLDENRRSSTICSKVEKLNVCIRGSNGREPGSLSHFDFVDQEETQVAALDIAAHRVFLSSEQAGFPCEVKLPDDLLGDRDLHLSVAHLMVLPDLERLSKAIKFDMNSVDEVVGIDMLVPLMACKTHRVL